MTNEMNAKKFLESLVAGDMITFHSQTATHWGIYVGDKKVVHLIGETIADSSDQSEALFTVAGKKYTKAVVNEEDFIYVADAFDTYERNCKDTPKMTPDDPEDIVELAKTMVGKIYYNEMWNSCKKLAIYCRYDLRNLSGTGDEENVVNEVDEDDEGDEDDEDVVTGKRPLKEAQKRAGYIALMTEAPRVKGQIPDFTAYRVTGQIPEFSACRMRVCPTPRNADPWGADQVPMDAAPLNIPDVKLSKRREFITRHNKEIIKELEKGDLVTFKRKWYYHWAVYIGDAKIIHLSGDEPITKSMKLIHIFSISGVPFSKGWVKLDDFWEVAFDSRADKNNEKDQLLTPKPVEEIVKTAKGMLGKIGYNILWNNCEHFASKCRYGTKRSDQVIFGVWCTIGIFAFAVLAKILQDLYNHS